MHLFKRVLLTAAFALLGGSAEAQRVVDENVFGTLAGPVAPGARVLIPSFALDDGTEVSLDVAPLEVFAPGAQIVVHGPLGESRVPLPSDRWFAGTVVGEPQSLVVLALGPPVRGFLVMKDRAATIEPQGGAYRDGPPGQTIVRMISDTDLPAAMINYRCDADALPAPEEALAPSASRPALTSVMYYAGVAVETDYEMYAKFNSIPNLTKYVGDLFAAVSAVYQRDVLVTLQVNYLSIWTTPSDPWNATSSTSAALSEFVSYWGTNRAAVPRSTAHMLSGKNLGGGIAYLSALCTSYGYGFSSSLSGVAPVNITTTYWDFYVVAHELGHNFGSPHTHCYSPPVDQCYSGEAGCYVGPTSVPPTKGTIMSYCHLLSGGYNNIKMFLGVPGEPSAPVVTLIRTYVEGRTSCFGTVPGPVVTGIAPLTGLGTGGTPVTISGTGFVSGATVKIGGLAATSVVFVNASTITAATPAHVAGLADVTVTNPGNQGHTLAGGYTYTCPYSTPTAGNTGPYCTGATISLSTPAVSGATYAWTGPNGFTSSTQNPTIPNAAAANAGIYIVTVTAASCVSTPVSTTVTVNPSPATPTAGNTGPYCAPATISLSTPAVSGATYAWTGPNGFTSSTQNPTIPGATTARTGAYNVTVTVAGCTSAAGTTSVVVNPSPATPTAGNTGPYCTGATISLSTPAVSGATYAWTGPNGFTSSAQNPTIPNAAAPNTGTYNVTVTATGCTSSPGTTSVVVNPTPTPAITAPASTLPGTTGLLASVVLHAGSSYAWGITNGSITAGAATNQITFTAGPSGVTTLSVVETTLATGCASPTTTANVFISAQPAGLVEDAHATGGTISNVDNVLEPGETVLVNPSWKNVTASPLTLNGTASAFTGPAGATYSLLDTSAGYGTIAAGATTDSFTAGGASYRLSVSNPVSRPATHWDATFLETLSNGIAKTWTLHVGQSFTDVPTSDGTYRFVETLLHDGISAGCGGGLYCPVSSVTRGQMAVFLSTSLVFPSPVVPASGTVPSAYDCSSGGNSLFGDVLPTDGICKFVHYIYAQGITAGCGGGNYCPASNVTRGQMAVFLSVGMAGSGPAVPASGTLPSPYNCTSGGNSLFGDVLPTDGTCKFIHYIYANGVTAGCGGGNYCPATNVTRGQMAVFLVTAFKLPFLY